MNELREARAVLDRLEEGLCTVDSRLLIRAGWNAAFERIFGHEDFVEKSIVDVAFSALSESQRHEVGEALEVALLSGSSPDAMVDALLPFREFEYRRWDGLSLRQFRLSLGLDRLIVDGQVEALLLRFIDKSAVSEETQKEKEARAEMEDQYARILQVFKNDRENVSNFFDDYTAGVKTLAAVFRSLKLDAVNSVSLDESVAVVHSLKAEAQALGFSSTGQAARSLELALKSRRSKVLDRNDIQDLSSRFDALRGDQRAFARTVEKLSGCLRAGSASMDALAARLAEALAGFDSSGYSRKILEEIAAFAAASGGSAFRDSVSVERTLALAVQREARKEGKLVRLSFQSDFASFPPFTGRCLKDALLHLARNSVAHGIETPSERAEAGKSDTGVISIRVSRDGNGFRVGYSDDGRGLDLPAIRAAAVRMGILSAERVRELDEKEAARLVFQDGLSAGKIRGDGAGLGCGLSAVASIVMKRLKGKIGMTHRGGKGLDFRFVFPALFPDAEKTLSYPKASP